MANATPLRATVTSLRDTYSTLTLDRARFTNSFWLMFLGFYFLFTVN